MPRFMGHNVDEDPITQKEREESQHGFAEADIPLLKTLRILKMENGQLQVNKKLAPTRNDIQDFLYWTTGSRKAPLPPIARRILCLKRAIIMNSIASLQTGNLQRTGENRQLEEIDALLRSDGVVNVNDPEKCASENSAFVGGVPPSPAPCPTAPPASKACETTVNCDSSAVTALLVEIKKAVDDLKDAAPAGADLTQANLEKLKEDADALNASVVNSSAKDHEQILEQLKQLKDLISSANTNAKKNPAQFDGIAAMAIEQANRKIDKAHETLADQLRAIDEKVTTIDSTSQNTKSGVNTIKSDLQILKEAISKISCNCGNKDEYIQLLKKVLQDAGIPVPQEPAVIHEERTITTHVVNNIPVKSGPGAMEANVPIKKEASDVPAKTEEGKAEEVAAEEGTAEEGKAEEGKAEEGAAEEGKAEEGKAEEGVAEEGVAEEGVAEEGVAEEGKAEEGDVKAEIPVKNFENMHPTYNFPVNNSNYDSDTSLPPQKRGKKPGPKSAKRAPLTIDNDEKPVSESDASEYPENHPTYDFPVNNSNYDSDTSLPPQQRGKKPGPKSTKGDADVEEQEKMKGEEEKAPVKAKPVRLVMNNNGFNATPKFGYKAPETPRASSDPMPIQKSDKREKVEGEEYNPKEETDYVGDDYTKNNVTTHRSTDEMSKINSRTTFGPVKRTKMTKKISRKEKSQRSTRKA